MIHDVTISNDGYIYVFLELIHRTPVRLTCKCLLKCSPMNREELAACIFKIFSKLIESRCILPTKSCLHWYRYIHRLWNPLHNTKSRICIYHKSRSISTFHHFFCWASHIYIYSSCTMVLEYFCGYHKCFWVISEYLKYNRLLFFVVRQNPVSQLWIMLKSVWRIKLRKNMHIWRDKFYGITKSTITIPIHGGECFYGSFLCFFLPVNNGHLVCFSDILRAQCTFFYDFSIKIV